MRNSKHPSSAKYFERKYIIMSKLKNISGIRKILYSILALLILVAAAYWLTVALGAAAIEATAERRALEHVEWLRYVEANVDPFRAKLRAAEHSDEFMFRETQISTIGDYHISVGSPSQEEPVGDGNGGYVIIQLFRDDDFHVFVRRYLDYPATFSVSITIANDENGMHMHGSSTDRDGNALPRHPDDSEELYLRWLEAIEGNKDVIEDMFDTARYIFEDLW